MLQVFYAASATIIVRQYSLRGNVLVTSPVTPCCWSRTSAARAASVVR